MKNMLVQKPPRLAPVAVAVAFAIMASSNARAEAVAPWLTQIGLSDSILSAANWGKGQLLGIVDTGISAGNGVFATGQVSNALSSCAAVTFKCSNGAKDDHGHGTAVAAIATANARLPFSTSYGGYTTSVGSIVGVAPNANIVAEKVLSASGAGYSSDAANGLRKAADAGASVINLSMTFGNGADMVAAINYAASKGAFIVWAGGNSAASLLNGANTGGLSAAAISRLIFVGSVKSSNGLSSFSNTPGTGALVDTAGSKTTYANRWVMTPGESIVAPYALTGSSTHAYWTGTSMSAPLASGSLILLQAAWPILKTNGTAANLLLTTTTDLGTKGVDASYGAGLVNVAAAFKPLGALAVTQANGKAVPIANLTGSMISSGALGGLATVQSKLASYTALDGYQRNFTVNLSGLIKSPTSSATLNPLPSNTNTGPNRMSLADGGEIAYWHPTWQPTRDEHTATPGVFAANTESGAPHQMGYAMLTDARGTTMALGYGNMLPAQYSYTKALYGADDAAVAAGALATHLTSLSQGGTIMAYGTQLGSLARFALSYSTSAPTTPLPSWSQGTTWASPNAATFGAGLSLHANDRLQLGVSLQSLNEKHGLLGSTYDPTSVLNLGSANRSNEIGISALFNIDRKSSLYVEASTATTRAANAPGSSMFAGISDLHSRSFGMSFSRRDLFHIADKLTLSLKQPLRVTAGAINIAVTNIDPITGVPTIGMERLDLAPAAREMDYKLSYDTPLAKNQRLSIETTYLRNAINTTGNNQMAIGMNWLMRF